VYVEIAVTVLRIGSWPRLLELEGSVLHASLGWQLGISEG
jgi:hypothetical protein